MAKEHLCGSTPFCRRRHAIMWDQVILVRHEKTNKNGTISLFNSANDTFPWKNENGTCCHEREKCRALCAMSFDWFSAVLHCESRRFSSALWELSFIAQQWLFGISNQKTFWGFLVNVKRSLSEPENLKRFFDERWQTELNSHSKLLNLLDKQCKKGRKTVKTH